MLGFEGKWAIHPNQVQLAHRVFSPDERLITRTRRIVAAMKEAAADGKGAVSLDGRLIDAASLRMAEHLLAKIALIEERTNGSGRPRACGILGGVARPIVLGVVGDSGAGKTTLTRGLARVLGERSVSYVSGDDYHRYERAHRAELGITPLQPAGQPPRHHGPAPRATCGAGSRS